MSASADFAKQESAVPTLPRVLASVLSYNSLEVVLTTLQCLSRQTYTQLKLQVIDNASTSDCVAQIARAFPNIEIKVLPENLGYTGGNNIALRQALIEGYDYAIICNHDIEVDEQTIERLVETAEANADTGVVGGVETSLSGRTRAIHGGEYCPWVSRGRKRTEAPTADSDRPWLRVPCVHGALVLFTRRALESGVILDENLFMYMDEIDIGFQLERKGLRAYTDQRVLVRHKSEPYQLDEYVGYLSQRNRLYLVKKYGRWYHLIFYHLYALLFELPIKVIIRSLQDKFGFARACVRGHIDGALGRMDRRRIEPFLRHSHPRRNPDFPD